jgi:hypothetical protein
MMSVVKLPAMDLIGASELLSSCPSHARGAAKLRVLPRARVGSCRRARAACAGDRADESCCGARPNDRSGFRETVRSRYALQRRSCCLLSFTSGDVQLEFTQAEFLPATVRPVNRSGVSEKSLARGFDRRNRYSPRRRAKRRHQLPPSPSAAARSSEARPRLVAQASRFKAFTSCMTLRLSASTS